MSFFRRRKSILEGVHKVTIEKIGEKKHENGKTYFIITVKRNSDGATREFWINEDNYLIEKIIDTHFEGDEREEFDTNDFIGKEIIIDVKKSNGDYFNITNVKSVDELEYDDEDEEVEYEAEDNLEDELLRKDTNCIEEDDNDDLDLDIDDFYDYDEDDDEDEDDDFLSKRVVNRRFR